MVQIRYKLAGPAAYTGVIKSPPQSSFILARGPGCCSLLVALVTCLRRLTPQSGGSGQRCRVQHTQIVCALAECDEQIFHSF